MCLAVPAKVLEVDRARCQALVDYLGSQMLVGTVLLEDVRPGLFVLVHVGDAIATIDEEQALDALTLWREWVQQP
ncbi:MAG TPA: HypC/HybG/HupF family hydrogenase formation chaperone [Symbiobacteriaceae bacterium]|nr:HypC/HybG/HupF family hydrogenase formation chaperone [Symbiobacteriaceae bacterium]